VHVIDGTMDEGLLGEVFSNHGLGTLIHANEYENIRPAQKRDVRGIQAPPAWAASRATPPARA
jgi:amino-acid N-acetyltransferase